MSFANVFFRIGGPLSPIPEIMALSLIAIIISVVILIKRIKQRKNGKKASLVGPIVATAILVNILAGAAFIAYIGYGIMTSM